MKSSEFCEKTYEVFVNHCIMKMGYNLYIPSQSREAKLAYDSLINNLRLRKGKILPIALQFKIASEYKYTNSLGHKFTFELYGNINKITNKKQYRQHNRLYELNNSSKYIAGYVVPSFVKNEDLYNHLKNGTLLKESCLIYPQHKILDEDHHYYSFNKCSAFQHSDAPLEDKIITLDNLFNNPENFMIKNAVMDIEEFVESFIYYIGNEDYNDFNVTNKFPYIMYKIFD